MRRAVSTEGPSPDRRLRFVPVRKLQPRRQMRVLLVHNPKSGDDDHGGDQLIELITRAGHEVTYHKAKRSWQSALDSEPDLVVAAGGDGTVSEVARAIGGRNMLVTALPLGTANNIAGWLGIAGVPVDQLVMNWDDGDMQPFDVGVADGPWGVAYISRECRRRPPDGHYCGDRFWRRRLRESSRWSRCTRGGSSCRTGTTARRSAGCRM